MTLKTGLGVRQSYWKCHHSISYRWLAPERKSAGNECHCSLYNRIIYCVTCLHSRANNGSGGHGS